jgi:ubiquinone/menaquinone biosynthesis C-methylase UbiE
MRVLDLACGTGHPALDEARLVQPGGSVVATDFVLEMVDATRRRAREAGIENLEARVMDAESIDFADESFGAVTCRFGLMFCPDPLQAAREVRRVLNTGGRFALSVWDEPQKSPGQTVLGEALGRLGHTRAPVNYDAPGIYQLAPPGKLEGVLRDAGFGEIRTESLSGESEYESFEALWGRILARPGPQRALVQQMSGEERQRLMDELANVIKPYTSDGIIRLRMTPLCAVATK